MHDQRDPPTTVAKVVGADFELANSITGAWTGPPQQAARRLLAEIDGYPRGRQGGTAIEYGRRFLDTCGSSVYIDSDHLEGNLPEHTSAFDHPNVLHGAGFQPARQAMRAAQRDLPQGTRINVAANCSDGRKAWGSHLNVLITRRCLENLLHRKPHHTLFFATHLVTCVPYTGQGLVGAANGRPACAYQLSQRADWFEKLVGPETMFDRPLVNSRDESHADGWLARCHIIYLDMVLSPVANILKAGTMQLVLAMLEADWIDPTIALDDPLAAASEISRDLGLRNTYATTVRGRVMRAVEIQRAMANLAGEFVASGAAERIVPRANEIVSLWLETLDLLEQGDVEALARRCDAWLKYLLLSRQRERRNLQWSSAEMRVADSLFGSLEPSVSLFYQAADAGFVERMPDEATIDHFASEPPDDTRAYFRAHVLRRYGDAVSLMDWSKITFRVPGGPHWWSVATIPMLDPRRLNRAESEPLFDACETLEELVDAANSLTERDTTAVAAHR